MISYVQCSYNYISISNFMAILSNSCNMITYYNGSDCVFKEHGRVVPNGTSKGYC